MSLRGKRDFQATKAQNFKCKGRNGSFVTLNGHLQLKGADKQDSFAALLERSGGICEHCGLPCEREGPNRGSMRHLKNQHNSFGRCDCPEGIMYAHLITCHFNLDHPGPQWSKHAPQTSD